MGGDLALDAQSVLGVAVRLLGALVDVVASNSWLSPALAAMEMCQMVTQGLWDKDSPLLQVGREGRRAHGREWGRMARNTVAVAPSASVACGTCRVANEEGWSQTAEAHQAGALVLLIINHGAHCLAGAVSHTCARSLCAACAAPDPHMCMR